MKTILLNSIKQTLNLLYAIDVPHTDITIEKTKDSFDGHFTFVAFPFSKYSNKNPSDTAKDIGIILKRNCEYIESYNVIQGFLNIKLSDEAWIEELNNLYFSKEQKNENKSTIMVEFSSPNTNKPLHLGHIRNNLLGDAISKILKYDNNHIIKVNLVNDRGIHICKSIYAWMKWGNGQTPETTGIKGDKFVGDFYVLFNEKQKEYEENFNDSSETQFSPLMEAQNILRKWEDNDPEILKIWSMMNSWVEQGFEVTYKNLDINFDKTYYESQTYLLGKDFVKKGLENGIFIKDPDNSVWIDLTNDGLDRKILLRKDGTAVYITQDIGTAMQRFEEYKPDKIIYVVGDEQNYHFEVLKKIVEKFEPDYASKIEHLSYGMVELPNGKMKSREGTVVDADDLIEEMLKTAEEIAKSSGKINELENLEKEKTLKQIAIAALKYYILKVDPKKQIIYNPNESIDFNGNTAPFIQYTYARIMSVLKNAANLGISYNSKLSESTTLLEIEIKLILLILLFNETIHEAAEKRNPGIIANYVYEIAKTYNKFYQDYSILKEKEVNILLMRLILSDIVAKTIKNAMGLLGIDVPEKM